MKPSAIPFLDEGAHSRRWSWSSGRMDVPTAATDSKSLSAPGDCGRRHRIGCRTFPLDERDVRRGRAQVVHSSTPQAISFVSAAFNGRRCLRNQGPERLGSLPNRAILYKGKRLSRKSKINRRSHSQTTARFRTPTGRRGGNYRLQSDDDCQLGKRTY